MGADYRGRVESGFISMSKILLAKGAAVELYNLPQYIETSSTAIDELDSTESEFVSGSASIKSTSVSGAGSDGAWISKSGFNLDFGGSAPSRLRFYAYAEDAANTDTIYIELVESDTDKFARRLLRDSSAPIVTGWNTFEVYPADWTLNGGATWSDTFVTIRFWNNRKSGATSVVSFDRVEYDYVSSPAVLLTIDDCHASDYTKAFTYMHGRNVYGTSYIISGNIGGVGSLSEAQLLEMDAAGWSIANHTDSGSGSYANCKTYLDGIGLSDASAHCATPGGGVDQAAGAEGMITARTTESTKYPAVGKAPRHYHIGSRVIQNTTTLTTAKSWVDEARELNRIVGLCFHRIVDSGASNLFDWLTADFEALVDYIIDEDLPFLTINDLYDSISGPITVGKATGG
jgi:hypothetical protein